MQRRQFIAGLSAAAAFPLAVRAQQPPLPLIAYLYGGTAISGHATKELAGFRQGLGEMGFVEGRNVHIEYRWADGQFDRIRPLVTELIGHHPAAIAVSTLSAALAAKALTTTPIIFSSGNDPVDLGLVDSLNRPGGNVTGVNTQGYLLVPKRLQILRELVPNAQTIAMLVNPDFPISASSSADAATAAAPILKMKVVFWRAHTESELDDVFARSAHGADALLVNPDTFFFSRNKSIVELAQRHSMPMMYPYSDNVVEGGLISYGPSRFDVGHQKGIYTGRILKGEKPADLPVTRPAKFELVINEKTAKALGLTIPETLLAIADEVIQ
jgi:putative tryptophan/tyrosine transport system substrate-binding protein